MMKGAGESRRKAMPNTAGPSTQATPMPKLKYRTSMPKPDDPSIIEPITQAILIGHPQTTAAALAGIHEDTLYHWRYQGEQELAELRGWAHWEELSSCARLVIHIKEAQAGFTDGALRGMRAGGKDWTMWCTLLERRRPKDFGRRTELTVEQKTFVLNVTAQLSPELALKLLQVSAQEGKLLPEGDVPTPDTD